ncbi:MAG: GntR family transcriptional regulator [Bacillota bacterium]
MIADIDRESPIPVYYQIQMDLKKRIMRHEWDAHEQIPTEMELAKQYEVSRITLRQALAELEKDGIIKKYRGKGTYVESDPTPFMTSLSYSLVTSDRSAAQHYSITADMLEQTLLTNLYPDVCEALSLKPTDKAVYIRRLFFLNGKPLALGRSYLSSELVPGLESTPFIVNSLSQTLQMRYGYIATMVEDSLEAVRSTQAECKLLQCTYDTPLILIKGISYLTDGRPLEYSSTLWVGDSVRFKLLFNRTNEGFVIKT